MPGAARQFEPQITRTGGVPSKYRFSARCSDCRTTDSYEASKPVPDNLVKRHFSDKGWVLGRDRSFDLCPACLRAPRVAPQNARTGETRNQGSRPADRRPQKIDDILARHLGKPAALAQEVFRPKDGQHPNSFPPISSGDTASPPALSSEIEQALTGMASDLKALRSAVELMAEQLSKLIVIGGQQIEAIARLTPVLERSTDSLSSELREVLSAVRMISDPLSSPVEQKLDHLETPDSESSARQDAEISSIPEPVQVLKKVELIEPTPPQKKGRKPRQKTSGQVVVKSIADAKRPNRFYTTVRVPRELWDRSAFRPDERIQIDLDGKTLSITRAIDGGVKPKSVGEAVVVLQSWKLGNLNSDQAKVARGDASLRLTLSS